MDKVSTIILAIIGIVASLIGISLLMAYPVKWTWNATMPYLFALKELSWGQAWCLTFLCGSLLKSSNTNTCNSKKEE